MSSYQLKQPRLANIKLGTLPSQPLVSIIIPSYNQGRYIQATINSILEQEYRPIKIHVIDGASTDETLKVLEAYGNIPELDWVSEPDEGVAEAVNKGFAKATGDIIGIQSSDDVYLPGAIGEIVYELKQRALCGLLYADIETVDANGSFMYRSDIAPFSLSGFLSKLTWIPQPSAFFRREMLETCGGWDSQYFCADTEFWLRMVFRTQVVKLDRCIARRRLHDAQRNEQKVKIRQSYIAIIKNSPDVGASSKELRKSALAGIHLNAIKYNESDSKLVASYHLWCALLADRSLWERYRKSPLLVPGWLQARTVLSRLKQWFSGARAEGEQL